MHGELSRMRHDPMQEFLALQDNAKKMKQNQELLEKRKKALDEAGAFRKPLGGLTVFKRGFKASYGEVEEVDRITGSVVHGKDGGSVDVKRAMPVHKESSFVEPSFARGDELVRRKREKIAAMMTLLHDFLGDDTKSMSTVAGHLRRQMGGDDYQAALHSVGATHLSDAVRLYADDFDLIRGGYYVQRS